MMLLPSQLRCILSNTDLVSGLGPPSLVFCGRAGWLLSGPGKTVSCQVMPWQGVSMRLMPAHGVKEGLGMSRSQVG